MAIGNSKRVAQLRILAARERRLCGLRVTDDERRRKVANALHENTFVACLRKRTRGYRIAAIQGLREVV